MIGIVMNLLGVLVAQSCDWGLDSVMSDSLWPYGL